MRAHLRSVRSSADLRSSRQHSHCSPLRYSTMRMAQKLGVAAILCLSITMIAMVSHSPPVGSVATTKLSNLGTSPVWGTYWQIAEACVGGDHGLGHLYTFSIHQTA